MLTFTAKTSISMANKITAKPTTTINEVQHFQPLFRDLFVGATYVYVDPFTCIPIMKIREATGSGVNKLIELCDYSKSILQNDGSLGFDLRADISFIVPWLGSNENYMYYNFKSSGINDRDVQQKMKGRDVWIGIVDGLHPNKAFSCMVTKRSGWSNMQWFVSILRGDFPAVHYHHLVHFQNHRHSPKYYVSLTLFDEINNLREEVDKLSQTSPAVSNITVARTYFAQDMVSRTMTCLLLLVLYCLGRILILWD